MKNRFKQRIKDLIFKSNIFFPKYDEKQSRKGFSRICHIHIRKCAGTSLNVALIKALGGGDYSYQKLCNSIFHTCKINSQPIVNGNKSLINKGAYFYAFTHTPFHELCFHEDTFTFTVLRNPIERIISHFNMLKDEINKHEKNSMLKRESSWAYGDFDHFLENIDRQHLERQLYTFSSKYNVEEALKNLEKINFVCTVENIADVLVPFLSREFDLNIKYARIRESKFKFKPSDFQIKRLKDHLKNELQFYDEARKTRYYY